MATRGTIQTSNSSFSDPLTVHPWKVLVDNICENLDDPTFEKFILFSKNVLGKEKCDELFECKSRVKYFSSLEDCCGEESAVTHIDHIVNIEKLHGNLGETDYRDEIKKYRAEKQRYVEECAKKGLSIDPDFVGRETLVEDILGYLQGNYKGVVLCGMGGVGKTALAGQICYRMKYCEKKWIIIPMNQREIECPEEFLLDLVRFLGTELNVDDEILSTRTPPSGTNLRCQLQTLFDTVEKEHKNVMFLVDNIDGMVGSEDKKQDFCYLMKDILYMVSSKSKVGVKFLLTSRIKMSKPTERSRDKVDLFDKSMIEVELKRLTEDESVRMLRRLSCASDETLPDTTCNQISSLCDGIPLAISIVASQIKDGVPVHRLIGYMQSQTQSTCLKNIVSKTLDKIASVGDGFDLKRFLIRLTIFDTAAFDLKACTAVGKQKRLSERESFGYSYVDKAEEDRRWFQLTKLKSYFLIEIDRTVRFRKQHDQVKETYSLHPLIHEHLKSMYTEDEMLNQEREMAKQHFLGYFCKLIQKHGEKCDMSDGEVRHFVENAKVHIRNWFNIIRREKLSLSTYLNEGKHKKPYLVACVCIMKMTQLVLDHREKALFASVQADITKSEKNLFPYMFWKSVEAECKIFDSRMQLAEELLDKVATELGVVSNETQCAYTSNWNLSSEDELPAWFKFYYTKSLLYHRKCQNENITTLLDRGLEVVNIADNLFSRKENKNGRKQMKITAKYFLVERADVMNLKGCIYFLKSDLDAAKKWHESALNLVSKYNDKHSSLMEYQGNIAACDHQLGLKSTITEEKNRLLDEALSKYTSLVGKNKRLLQNDSLNQAGILRNRADIYYVQSRLDKALADGKCVLNIMNKHYRPPHIDITQAIERVAHYHLKIGKQKRKDMDDDGQRHLEEAVDYYEKLLIYIIKGGLPLEHRDGRTFRVARDNHIKALELLKYTKKEINGRLRKYQDFHDGKYNRNIQQSLLQDPDFIPSEFLRECRESGVTFIPEKIDSDTESDIDTEDSESESSTEPSVSDSAESMENEKPDNVRNEPPIMGLHRRDSGIEEEPIRATVLKEEMRIHNDASTSSDPHIPLDVGKTMPESASSVVEFNQVPRDGQELKVEDGGLKPLNKRRFLKRQMSIDIPDKEMSMVTDVTENENSFGVKIEICESSMISDEPSTSTAEPVSDLLRGSCSSTGSGREKMKRSAGSSSSSRRDTWTSYDSQDSTFGDYDSFEETERRRRILSSSGSQGSVTSKMGRMLKLNSVDDKKDNSDVDEPAPKLSKLDTDTS